MKRQHPFIETILEYSRGQRIGVVLLFLLILILQGIYWFSNFSVPETDGAEKDKWLAHQVEIDSLKEDVPNTFPKLYPFNPNFISDYKGYKLGMSVEEIDRLHAFRRQNKFVNSAEEFQQVTKVSDSLLKAITPYFKFPDWVKNKKMTNTKSIDFKKEEKVIVVSDINIATKEDLMKIYGIGDKISDRILIQREKLGAFVSMEQMLDVWGLSPEVVSELNKNFAVKSTARAKRIAVNKASVRELAQFPYFKYSLAKDIVIYRSMNGDITTDDLSKIKGFPVDKIKIIAIYLDF